MQLLNRLRGGRMLAVLALSAGTALPLSAQRSSPPAGQAARMAVFTVADSALAAALRRIDAGSPSWRAAIDSVADRGGSIVVATVRELAGVPEQFARGELAEASPIVRRIRPFRWSSSSSTANWWSAPTDQWPPRARSGTRT